jgi:hypothetical protein
MSELSDGSPARPRKWGFGKLAAAVLVCALAAGAGYWAWSRTHAADPASVRQIAGIWQLSAHQAAIKPADGGPIPFTPAGRAAYEKNINGLRDGTVADFAATLCLPPGVLRAMGTADPFEIVQTDDMVAVIVKGFYYLVRLNAQHYADDIEFFPAFMGFHVGHWEGDTLVIDTRGFNPYTWLDDSGLPHGFDLHTVQRLRRIEGGRLENVITIEDKEFFTKPWEVRFVYQAHSYLSTATDTHPCDHRDGVVLPSGGGI